MPIPAGIRPIDTYIHMPYDGDDGYKFLKPLLRDKESLVAFSKPPTEFLFKGMPEKPADMDVVDWVLREMDRFEIERALIDVTNPESPARRALKKYPERFIGEFCPNPNMGMDDVLAMQRAYEELGIRAAGMGPAFFNPQVPINDKKMYPIYAKCSELGIPIFITVGAPGPRVPMACQHVELLDEVCWFFPDLNVVMRHGGEPWVDSVVKLLLRWPNLYFATSGFAPKHIPKDVIEFANKRGANKLIYSGYFAAGLSLERTFSELQDLPLRDHVWQGFLRDNALRVMGLLND